MRIVMQMKWDGATPEQYEKMRKSVNWEGNIPRGGVFHVAGFTDNAIRVTDIWESPDDLNNFVQNRLMQGARETGVEGEPQVEVFPVHAVFIPALQAI